MFFQYCVICGKGTLWAYLHAVLKKGEDTGYDAYGCTSCPQTNERMISLQPRSRRLKEQPQTPPPPPGDSQ
jgi:hypothetical protein